MNETTHGQPEVPAQIFERFLARLAESDLPTEVVDGLREAIIEDNDLSERAIRAALFPAEESP
jgi:hypothetical protein